MTVRRIYGRAMESYLSVATLSLAIDVETSSWLPAALRLVSGVFSALPFTEPEGVDVDVDAVPPADFFAAFSARRFCFDAEGAMVVVV